MPAFDPLTYRYASRRNVVYAKNAVACTSVPLGAQIGLDVMKSGGNAVDAAVAMAAAMPLLEPTGNGLGSDCFALVWIERDKRLYGLNASGVAPMALSAEKVRAMGYTEMPKAGWLPTMVPGAPAGWAELNRRFPDMGEYFAAISPRIATGVTVSTLHGCPPDEIEAIASYLIREKGLNTFVKCNPTILGYDFARERLNKLGYDYIAFDEHHFNEDLQYADAVPMFRRLMQLAEDNGVEFGLKLSRGRKGQRTAQRRNVYVRPRALSAYDRDGGAHQPRI